MPESDRPAQAVEWLIDIRWREVGSSGFLVFDSGQLSGGNEQGGRFLYLVVARPQDLRELRQTATLSSFVITRRRSNVFTENL